jgi:hypothetical protein
MSITISFGIDGPLDWDAADRRKLEDAVDVLRRRCGLEVDRPVERRYLQRALGDLEPVLYGVAVPAVHAAARR